MIAFVTIVVLLGLSRLTQAYWERYRDRTGEAPPMNYWAWLSKGLAGPIVVVTLFNTGWMPGLPPLLGSMEAVSTAGWTTSRDFYYSECAAAVLVGVWWTAFSLGWLLGIVAAKLSVRGDLSGFMRWWGLLGTSVALVVGWHFGSVACGAVAAGWFLLLLHVAFEQLPRRQPLPTYSKAIGKMKLGKLEEAEWAIIDQLEQFENDFQGWMLLAELYAEHHGDMSAAEQTVLELCAQDSISCSDISVALHRLADWYLKVADDPGGARFALEEICRRAPNTHLERMARQRIQRLPVTREAWKERKQGRRIALPSVDDPFRHAGGVLVADLTAVEARARADEYVQRLRENPDDARASGLGVR